MKEIDLDIGDTILTGKWKNKPVEVESFGTDDKGQPTVNGKAMLNFRIKKLLPGKDKAMDEQTRMKILAGIHPTIIQEALLVERKIGFPSDTPEHVRHFFEFINSVSDGPMSNVEFIKGKWVATLKDEATDNWHDGGEDVLNNRIHLALSSSIKYAKGKYRSAGVDVERRGVARIEIGEV